MCKNFKGSYSGGSSFVNVNDCWLLQKLFVYQRYKFSFEKKKNKKKKNKESQYMVSHPETGSDSPIGSDRDRGRDSSPGKTVVWQIDAWVGLCRIFSHCLYFMETFSF